MMLGLGLSLPNTLRAGGGLRSLFAGGYSGFLFEAMTGGILFQDVAATTPVAIDGDPVGRVNDQSGNGTNATIATGTQRPFWKPNSGKPYLLPDAVDDRLVTGFVGSASPGLTIAIACRIAAVNQIAIGGGLSTGNRRAYIGTSGVGTANFAWGNGDASAISGDIRGLDVVLIMAGDAVGRSGYLNGVDQALIAPSSSPDGTGGGIALGAYNNNGVPTGFMGGRIYAGLAINRKITPAEVSLVTAKFKSTYQ